MAIKIEMLRAFNHVAQTGNLSEAANRLGRTQSAISMTLKQLEDHLGEKLFEGERKNRLTPLGEQVFALAQQELQNFDATVRQIETSARSPSGLLRIASIPSTAGIMVPKAVEQLTDRHDGLKIDIRDTDTDMVIDSLVRGQADVGIASGQPNLNGVHTKVLFQDLFGLTCAPEHPLAQQKTIIGLADVLAANFMGNSLCRQIEHPDVAQALASTRLHAHNTISLIGMIQTGKWVTLLPQSVVQDLPGNLTFRAVADLRENRVVSTLVSQRSSQISFANEFVEILENLTALET